MKRFAIIVLLAFTTCMLVMPSTASAGTTAQKAAAKKVVRDYFDHQNAERWRSACRLLSPEALRAWGGGTIAACADNFATNGFSVTRMDITRTVLFAGGRRAIVHTYLFGDPAQKWRFTMIKKSVGWRILATSD